MPNEERREESKPSVPRLERPPFRGKPDFPHPVMARPPLERPVLPQKSTDDLKAILRTMTAKNSVEKENKQTERQKSLKGTLAEVLQKKPVEAGPPQEPKPVAAEPPRETLPVTPPQSQEKKPFEVPEDALRKVLKGES